MTSKNALIQQYQGALERFADVLGKEKDEYLRDSAIQRFEFTFDLAWKLLKQVLENYGVSCNSPRMCFKEAYRQGFIGYEDRWLEMIEARNWMSHAYDEEAAERVYQKLPGFLELFRELEQAIDKSE
jgi:nucleotidyltransferase substrate binding protein (TIGR01987 family)